MKKFFKKHEVDIENIVAIGAAVIVTAGTTALVWFSPANQYFVG